MLMYGSFLLVLPTSSLLRSNPSPPPHSSLVQRATFLVPVSPTTQQPSPLHKQQSLTNERYVSILNHCFDDIERFIIRLQHAAAALRELQLRNHKRKGHGAGDGLLAMRARGPSEEEFFEILAKFKLAFNLLAKLKGTSFFRFALPKREATTTTFTSITRDSHALTPITLSETGIT